MATTELQQSSSDHDTEGQMSSSGRIKHGGWITFLFVTGTVMGLTLAAWGWISNLMVYLIEEFNVKSVDAAQISNVGSILFALTAMLDSLRPPPCERGSLDLCKPPSRVQFGVLYSGLALLSVGAGGPRSVITTMGANQLNRPEDRAIFFNLYFFTNYMCAAIGSTAIVYIEDNVSWALGFGICVLASLIGLAIFLSGRPFYCYDKPPGRPFLDLARVIVACFRKRKLPLSSRSEDYYYGFDGKANTVDATPAKNFRILSRAALKTEGDLKPDGSVAKPWRLCTVQQVEDLKALIRILPLWSSNLFVSTPKAIQASLTVLQALTMDRHLGSHFKIPAGSFQVLVFISSSISVVLVDRFLFPMWRKLTSRSPTPLQRIGVGHTMVVLSMAVSALVESKRLKVAHNHGPNFVPMLALWLFPQLVLVGIGEAFHMPSQVGLYYQEFPMSLRNTATSMAAMVYAIAFYFSSALIDLIRRVTEWLPDDINKGRLDNVYWLLVVVGILNFGYFLMCSTFFKYQSNADKERYVSNSGSDM
ncbi:Nitrate excretion transporter 1 [Morus notabilis]|uniref:Nitrate excretion transporter 1 n=1 Tax=Morus notabilis TaxID=981085 RepID=W9SYS2_9ROSA|nr:Nitrate excretion transporter 1 [Morus notabilis]